MVTNQPNKQTKKQKENPEFKKEIHEPKLVFCLLFKDQITVFAFQELLLLEGMLASKRQRPQQVLKSNFLI